MKAKAFLTFTLLSMLLGVAPRASAAEDRGMRLVPDPVGQFFSLTREAEALGAHTDGSPDASLCRHYQAMVRVDGSDGTPFFILSRSGNKPDAVSGLPFDGGCFDGDGENGFGHLVVFRMGSRDKNGERLRSNRLSKLDFIDQTQPSPGDKATIFYTVTEDGLVPGNGPSGSMPPRIFSHPGGMQVVGHTLALALEEPCQFSQTFPALACEPTTFSTMIQFYDVSDPEHPVLTSKFSPHAEMGGKCGVVGVAPLPDGRNLLVAAGGNAVRLFFYRSNVAELNSPGLTWEPVGNIPGPDVLDAHQTLQFLKDPNGRLFLAGARGHPLKDQDRIDLYRVDCDPSGCAPGGLIDLVEVERGKAINAVPTSFGSQLANLAAASTFYVSPSGELIFYAAGHDNDGPGKTLKIGEFRHKSVVQHRSPTLLPHADLEESYEVEEGDSITLTGAARPPVTRAFIQLFREKDAGNLCTVVDYDDEDLDDFDNIGRFCVFGSEDGIRSWGWYAPEGCSISASHTLHGGIKTLRGTGRIESDFDLSTVQNNANLGDMEKRVNKVVFEGDCDAYYDTGVDLEWDLDQDGVFETTGTEVTFDSAGLDGPSVVSLPVQARHPESTLPGTAVATVVVHNKRPVVNDINVLPLGLPFMLVGLPVTLNVDFSDPGIPDHQTATIAWGDGASDPHTAFDSFNDAFGGVIGHAIATHVYTSPAEYQISITITDDDGDAEVDGAKVKVLTVAQALDAVIDLLDDLIAGTSDAETRKILEKVAKALYGNPHALNGAREMLNTGNEEAAIAFLNQAIGWLEEASSLGAETTMLTAILEMLIVALNAGS